ERLSWRESESDGRRLAFLSFCVGTRRANSLAAAMTIASVTRLALEATIPSASPGNMYELLVWSMRTFFPQIVTGSNGLPVPISARPSVQSNKSWGVASQRAVGFESGKMMG